MSRFCTNTVDGILPYTPGEQPQDKKYIKLNTNENPYAVSKNAIDAISKKTLENLRLYCDPEAKNLVEAVAEFYGVDKSCVLLANGSDEILAFSFLAFCKGKKTAFCDITYGFYKVYAKLFEVEEKIIPLLDDFNLDVEAFKKFDGNVILANPNAQTGLFVENGKMEEIIKAHEKDIVLVDEAYADFAKSSLIDLTKKYDNLLVVGTFSKSRSLAGARLGFAIANKEIIDDLKKVKYSFNPYNVNTLTQILGRHAIEDRAYFEKTRDLIVDTRENFKNQLKELGFDVLDSRANFVLCKSDEIVGVKLYEKLRDKGVLVRYLGDERIKEFVRISIGTSEEMNIVIEKIKEILKEEK
ncbi:MAG: histidinol-phosphate transaminase [Clostridia bacterium]|nr:histidinol-phosphate transaminase [Clostridia bacterium]